MRARTSRTEPNPSLSSGPSARGWASYTRPTRAGRPRLRRPAPKPHEGTNMNMRTKLLGAVLAATVAVGVITAASASASKPAHHFRAGHGKGSITGFPNEIKTVDL